MRRVSERARGHENITWYCIDCGRRNRAHVQLDDGDVTVPCQHCPTGAADIIPASVVVYGGSVGETVREGATTEHDAAG